MAELWKKEKKRSEETTELRVGMSAEWEEKITKGIIPVKPDSNDEDGESVT
jgi:hypothetical protein